MHDAKGRELKVGDKVMIPGTVTRLGESAEDCNVEVTAEATMPPDHNGTTSFGAVNTRQILRANVGDELGYEIIEEGSARIMQAPAWSRSLADDRMMKWFVFSHLPDHLKATSSFFWDAACQLVATVDPGPERTVALRKLLEAKDAAVRAKLNAGG